MNSRENNYDLLRIIAILGVILMHVVSIFTTALVLPDVFGQVYDGDLTQLSILDMIARIGVPLFVMLSGAFTLGNDKNSDFKYYYKKLWKKIGIPSVIACIVYVIIKLLMGFLMQGTTFDVFGEVVRPTLIGTPYYHLWYLFAMLWVWVLTPVVIKIKKKVGQKAFLAGAVVYMILATFSGLFITSKVYYDGIISLQLMGYYLTGYVIKETTVLKRTSKAATYFMCFVLCTAALSYIRVYQLSSLDLCPTDLKWQLGNMHPLVVIQTVYLFAAFSHLEIKKEFQVAQDVFLIYLIHAFILDVLKITVLRHFGLKINSMIVILVTVFITFMLSYFSGKAVKVVANIISRKEKPDV